MKNHQNHLATWGPIQLQYDKGTPVCSAQPQDSAANSNLNAEKLGLFAQLALEKIFF